MKDSLLGFELLQPQLQRHTYHTPSVGKGKERKGRKGLIDKALCNEQNLEEDESTRVPTIVTQGCSEMGSVDDDYPQL